MKTRINKILRKRISDKDKLEIIKLIVNEDTSDNLWMNKLVKIDHKESRIIIDNYWKDMYNLFVDKLDSYIYSTWKYYPSHYLTILNWLRRDWVKPIPNKSKEWICSMWTTHKLWKNCTCI